MTCEEFIRETVSQVSMSPCHRVANISSTGQLQTGIHLLCVWIIVLVVCLLICGCFKPSVDVVFDYNFMSRDAIFIEDSVADRYVHFRTCCLHLVNCTGLGDKCNCVKFIRFWSPFGVYSSPGVTLCSSRSKFRCICIQVALLLLGQFKRWICCAPWFCEKCFFSIFQLGSD